MRDEVATERRLEYEARTLVKTICTGEPVVNVAKVEITWQYPDDLRGCCDGLFRVLGDLNYSSIDDIYAV